MNLGSKFAIFFEKRVPSELSGGGRREESCHAQWERPERKHVTVGLWAGISNKRVSWTRETGVMAAVHTGIFKKLTSSECFVDTQCSFQCEVSDVLYIFRHDSRMFAMVECDWPMGVM